MLSSSRDRSIPRPSSPECQEKLRRSCCPMAGLRSLRLGETLRDRYLEGFLCRCRRPSSALCSNLLRSQRDNASRRAGGTTRTMATMRPRHIGHLSLSAVQTRMHSRQKVCLHGSTRAGSVIWPRQMGHVSSPGASSCCSCWDQFMLLAAALARRRSSPGISPGARRFSAACGPQHLH